MYNTQKWCLSNGPLNAQPITDVQRCDSRNFTIINIIFSVLCNLLIYLCYTFILNFLASYWFIWALLHRWGAVSKNWTERRSVLHAERIRVCDFSIFDQAQVQDRESSHYGLRQISIGSNDKPLYNTAKQHQCLHKHTPGFRKMQWAQIEQIMSNPKCIA